MAPGVCMIFLMSETRTDVLFRSACYMQQVTTGMSVDNSYRQHGDVKRTAFSPH